MEAGANLQPHAFFLNTQKTSGLGSGGGSCRAYLHLCAHKDMQRTRGYSFLPTGRSRAIKGYGLPSLRHGGPSGPPRLDQQKAKEQREEEAAAVAAGSEPEPQDRDEVLERLGW
eukprot:COSAG04_NODE_529_length_13029_cov_3.203248_6_plen_114_part_00